LGIPTTSRWTVANINRDEPGQSYALTSAYSRGDGSFQFLEHPSHNVGRFARRPGDFCNQI
jgi:hypothetical protein